MLTLYQTLLRALPFMLTLPFTLERPRLREIHTLVQSHSARAWWSLGRAPQCFCSVGFSMWRTLECILLAACRSEGEAAFLCTHYCTHSRSRMGGRWVRRKTGTKWDRVSKKKYRMGMYPKDSAIQRYLEAYVLYSLSILLVWIIILTIDFFSPSSVWRKNLQLGYQ